MKKTRILSMLLSAMMAVSSLPVVASATNVDEELITNGTQGTATDSAWTGVGTSTVIGDTEETR